MYFNNLYLSVMIYNLIILGIKKRNNGTYSLMWKWYDNIDVHSFVSLSDKGPISMNTLKYF